MIFLADAPIPKTPLFTRGDIIAICAIAISTLIIIIQSRGKTIQDIKDGIDRIEKFLILQFGAETAGIFMTNHSPTSLTASGVNLLNESGGKKLIDENLDFFIAELHNTLSKTAPDAENNAFEVIFKNSDNKNFKGIKDFIYNHSVYEGSQINLTAIVKISSIYLRDKYFEKYPDILQSSASS
jgi:hypothetical protein